MSPPTSSEEQAKATEHDTVALQKPGIRKKLSSNLSADDDPRNVHEGDEQIADSEQFANETAVISPPPEKPSGSKDEGQKNNDGVTGPGEEDGDHAILARDIERRASEHLARRAAEMTVKDEPHGTGQAPMDMSFKENEALPSTPPPPAPPKKDKTPVRPSVIQTEFDEKHPPPPNEETANDVPEPPQGTSEATGAEILNIMDQFDEGMSSMAETEIMSPRLARQQSVLVLPPRSSSLEPQQSYTYHRQFPRRMLRHRFHRRAQAIPSLAIASTASSQTIKHQLQVVALDQYSSLHHHRQTQNLLSHSTSIDSLNSYGIGQPILSRASFARS